MLHLRKLMFEDAEAVLAFELENRAYFARSVSDRGDAFFERFDDHHAALLAKQDAGICVFHVLVEPDGTIAGRINLFDLEAGAAHLGYRIAERVTGRGVATVGVKQMLTLARDEYGLGRLVAEVSATNPASQRVLRNAGFVPIGVTKIRGTPATRYERAL